MYVLQFLRFCKKRDAADHENKFCSQQLRMRMMMNDDDVFSTGTPPEITITTLLVPHLS
jgi:hypothetical protein